MRGMLGHIAKKFLFIVLMALAGISSASARDIAEYFARHNESAQDTPMDFAPWSHFLTTYVEPGINGVNRIDYKRVSDEDHEALVRFIDITLATIPVSRLRRQEQLAYWINLYNALIVRVALDHYPVSSIRDINISGLFSRGPFKRRLAKVENREISLSDIRDIILMPPIFNDSRIPYALCDGTMGGPQIWPEAFQPATIDFQLNRAATNFVNHPRAFSIEDTRLTASMLYKWQKTAFGKQDVDILLHAIRFADPGLVPTLSSHSQIDDYFYDWRLNEPDIFRP